MTTLDELRERLEKAEGPDRELDAALEWLHCGDYLSKCTKVKDAGRELGWKWITPDGSPLASPEPYTASLDAAIDLVEAKLPGWARMMTEYPDGIFEYRLGLYNGHWDENSGHHFSEEARYTHKSEPIALLLALLSALEKESTE